MYPLKDAKYRVKYSTDSMIIFRACSLRKLMFACVAPHIMLRNSNIR